MDQKEQLILKLFEIGAVKFGSFILKSGIESPIYFDLRILSGYPTFLEEVAGNMWSQFNIKQSYDQICGVPYTALPIATSISIKQNIPMIVRRKEAKTYGTKKLLEGVYKKGDKCVIIEDVIVSGASVLETVQCLKDEGLEASDVIVFIDRRQGGVKNLENFGINVLSVLNIDEILSFLLKEKHISSTTVENVYKFLDENSNVRVKEKENHIPVMVRLPTLKNPVKNRIISIMQSKQSNLCVAVDVKSSEELLNIADTIGPHICILKTHIDILEDFTPDVTESLKKNANKHNYLIMEDRKFADIGKTVIDQYKYGMHKILDFADIVTVHGLPGKAVIEALSSVSTENKACVLVAELSSEGNLCNKAYTESCIAMGKDHPFVIGFVAQSRHNCHKDDLIMMPGVSIDANSDKHGQRYGDPRSAIERGADILIVGRGVTTAPDFKEAAEKYQNVCYSELMSKYSNNN